MANSCFLYVFVVITIVITTSNGQYLNISNETDLTTTQILNSWYYDNYSSTSYLFSTSFDEYETLSFEPYWLYAMITSGFLGIVLISTMSIHTIRHFLKDKIIPIAQCILHTIFFISALCISLSYAFIRTDLILPMGSIIDCKYGFYISTNSVFMTKLLIFTIFLYRIDSAFHRSALGYPRAFLLCVWLTYMTIICTLNSAHVYASWDLVTFVRTPSDEVVGGRVIDEIGLCTTGANEDRLLSLVLGSLFLGDMIFSTIVCVLFVYKLRKVIKLTDDGHKFQTKHEQRKHSKLTRLMRKQTILVLLSVLTTFSVLGLGAWNIAFTLLIPLDAIINTFCVWLMFSFADPIWNKIMHCICFCCYCCVDKEDFLVHLHSLSRRESFRRSVTGGKRPNFLSTSSYTSETARSPSISGDSREKLYEKANKLTSIEERRSEKHKDIKIDFTNGKRVSSMHETKPKTIELESVASIDSEDEIENDNHAKNLTIKVTKENATDTHDKSQSKSTENAQCESPQSAPEKILSGSSASSDSEQSASGKKVGDTPNSTAL